MDNNLTNIRLLVLLFCECTIKIFCSKYYAQQKQLYFYTLCFLPAQAGKRRIIRESKNISIQFNVVVS